MTCLRFTGVGQLDLYSSAGCGRANFVARGQYKIEEGPVGPTEPQLAGAAGEARTLQEAWQASSTK